MHLRFPSAFCPTSCLLKCTMYATLQFYVENVYMVMCTTTPIPWHQTRRKVSASKRS